MSDLLTLPRLGETMEEGRVTGWMVAPGAQFRRGDTLLEVETDKTVVEVPALRDGTLGEILAAVGDMVRVGAPLARLAGAEGAATTQPAPEPTTEATPAPPAAAPAARKSTATGVRATRVARRLARQAGLDIAALSGTGRRGRIERADVEAALAGAGPAASTGLARDLAHAVTGPEDGAPIVLLHGFGADHSIWAGLSAGLVRAGRRVLAVDLPGHGATRAEAPTPAALATGLSPLVRDVLPGPAHIVAHSMGAIPAIALADAGDARSLTLIAPAGLGLAIDREVIAGFAAARAPGEVAHLLDRMTATPLALSPAALQRVADDLARGRLRALAEALLGGAGQAVSIRRQLAGLAESLPVRILAPHRDRILDWRDMVDVSPRIAVHHLPGAGHMAAWDAPQEVLAIVLAETAP
jgi:pimeloyl-ACP methyl ester carboxylesterase